MTHSNVMQASKLEAKETLTLGIPIIAAQLIYSCSGFIGTALVARLGEDALAASVLVSMIWLSLSIFFFGILNSISVLISHNYGARNYKTISEIMAQAFYVGIFLCLIMIGLLLLVPLIFVHYTEQSAHVIKLSIEYMHALLWTLPGLVALIIYEQFLSGISKPKLILRISFVVVPVEIFLIYSLIFGKFGFPACGIAGIGYGFATTYTIVAIALISYLATAKTYREYGIFKSLNRIQWTWIKEIFRVGLPMGCMHVIEISTFTFGTLWIAHFGTTALAAHQIVIQYLTFTITLVFAMSQAVTIRVGQRVGERNMFGLQYAVYVGMFLNSGCILLICLAFNLFPKFFLQLDLDISDPNNTQLIKESSALLAIVGVLLIFDNIRLIGFGALRGLKDTKFSMYTSFFAFWVCGTSCAYLLGFSLNFQTQGIWWGLTMGIVCGMIIVLLRLRYLLKHLDIEKILAVK